MWVDAEEDTANKCPCGVAKRSPQAGGAEFKVEFAAHFFDEAFYQTTTREVAKAKENGSQRHTKFEVGGQQRFVNINQERAAERDDYPHQPDKVFTGAELILQKTVDQHKQHAKELVYGIQHSQLRSG